ncbi:MAG TPA: hypothetical protein VH744_07800 [Terriglobales bacterium]
MTLATDALDDFDKEPTKPIIDFQVLLSVNLKTGRYYCHKCQSHGNQLELWAAVHRLPIHEAVIASAALSVVTFLRSIAVEPASLRNRTTTTSRRGEAPVLFPVFRVLCTAILAYCDAAPDANRTP